MLKNAGRAEEARLLFEGAITVARRAGDARVELRALGNLADLCMTRDLPGAEDHCQAALALARRAGAREDEAFASDNLMYVLITAGRLNEASQLATDLLSTGGDDRPGAEFLHNRLAHVQSLRGDATAAREHLSVCRAWSESDDLQIRAMYDASEAIVAAGEGEHGRALQAARLAIDKAIQGPLDFSHEAIRSAFPQVIEAAIALPDLAEGERFTEMFAAFAPGDVPPFLRGQVARSRGLLGAARGANAGVEQDLTAAEAMFRDLGYPYWTARAQLDRAEWLAHQARTDEAARLAGEAVGSFEAIGAAPMLARARALIEPLVTSRSTQA